MMSGLPVSSGLLYSRPVPHLPVPRPSPTTLRTLLWARWGNVRVVTTLCGDLVLLMRVVRVVSSPVFISRTASCSGDMFPLYTVSSVVHSLAVKGEGWRHSCNNRPYQLLSHSCNNL